MTKIEKEKKYLLRSFPKLDYKYEVDIFQFYINDKVRFRRESIKYYDEPKESEIFSYFCCVKKQIGDNPCINEETQFNVDEGLFNKIFENGQYKFVKKKRYCYFYENHKFEIDVFENQNIILCEVEYDEEEKIKIPEEIDIEIIRDCTFDTTFKNHNLAILKKEDNN